MIQSFPPCVLPGYEHIIRYWDAHNHHSVAKILPGEYYVTCHDEILMTVVGSCVSACIRDCVSGIGGMNHFMLPFMFSDNWELPCTASRYGRFAMDCLISDILKYGGLWKNLEVKLFGGAHIIKNMSEIGQKNIDFVKTYIETEELTLLAEDLGDIYPRKILFYPVNGRVRVKKLLHNSSFV
ncbi:MAG: chemoreceptor glutamine deamidase CheD [Gammaproteobacteria bacterium]|nr:MAG: chemoreceptor glutamine deamidase CheD [Gammaproteobacteria bacterium]RKZ77125.1 MAG: chemoreceptor glutamine deamidase CheD [Gammaproteobacteria bacterium]